MNYRYYTTTTIKKHMYPSSLKWVINKISSIQRELRDTDLKVDNTLKSDLKNVVNELNETVNELLIKK